MDMDYRMVGVLIVGAAALFMFLNYIRWFPIHWIGKAMVHIVIGVFLLFFINVFGEFFHINIPLNVITVGIAGFLGIPGVIALICIKLFII